MLNIILITLSLLTTIPLSIFTLDFSAKLLLIIPYLIGSYIVWLLLFILFVYVYGLFFKRKKEYDKVNKFSHFLLRLITVYIYTMCGARLKVEGLEKVKNLDKFLLVSNHRSNFDPIFTYPTFHKNAISMISKRSNLKIPIFGKLVATQGFIGINRDNDRDAIKSVIRAKKQIVEYNRTVCVYPEGTRNTEGEGLLPFRSGCFKIAQSADVPIVIMTIKDSDKMKNRMFFKKTIVKINVLEIIDPKNFANTNEISSYVEGVMLKDLAN